MSVVSVQSLSKTFHVGFWGRPLQAVSDLSFEVGANEVFGFLGPNGSGKTTTLKCLTGLIRPSAGRTLLFDRPVEDLAVRARLGFLPERPYFYEHLTGSEFLHYYARLLGLRGPVRVDRVEQVFKLVALGSSARTQRLGSYSKGMLQRIGLAQALLGDPELVLLDEPMSGLDPVGRADVRDLILDLKSQGRTVLFSTHILPDIEMVCDRVAIIVSGKLVRLGSLQELLGGGVERWEISFRGGPEQVSVETERRLPDGRRVVEVSGADKSRVLSTILAQGGDVVRVMLKQHSLEDLFLQVVPDRRSGGDA